jgi:hypothetical protein
MKPSTKLFKRVLALLLLVCLAWICWKFQPWTPGGRAIQLSSVHLDAYDFQIWQRKNGLLDSEPFATALFVRKSGGPWTAYLLDIQDLYREEITLQNDDSGVAVLYGKTKRAYFDKKQDVFTLYHYDGRPDVQGGTLIDSEPRDDWWERRSANAK